MTPDFAPTDIPEAFLEAFAAVSRWGERGWNRTDVIRNECASGVQQAR